ncbi:hypothetical protein MTR67_031785 [Solanum verrucosum]|uniref:Uncharacterized protein n=1 Tax=Solanum verrucosum TaxID=315347 RepID=A0AAF0U349_SOLVR|nr:hypothetical protein MTR67_031785 [Solanum verrucosum]
MCSMKKNTRGNELTPNGIKTTASRESAFVIMNHINLVEIFMVRNINDVRIMTRQSINNSGSPRGIILKCD